MIRLLQRTTGLSGFAALVGAALLFTGPAVFAAGKGGNKGPDHTARQDRPILLGVSGSGIEFFDVDGSLYCYAGTLGSLVDDGSGNKFVLSNNHVLARENWATIGEATIQPGLLDENGDPNSCSPNGTVYDTYIVGTLSDYVMMDFNEGNNLVDAAIAAVSTSPDCNGDCVDPDGQILEIGGLSGIAVAPTIGLAVQKSGRTTGLTTGSIGAVGVEVDVTYEYGVAHFIDQILVSGDKGAFLKSGDSGSLLVTRDSPPDAVGLLFAGSSSGIAIANTIENVLSELDTITGKSFSMVACPDCGTSSGGGGHGGGGSGGGGNGGGGGHGKPTLDARGLDIAKAARDRHRDALMAIPDVVGTGIGADENGEPVVQVYTSRAARSVDHPVPSELDGVKVKVIVTGEFRAF